MHFTKTSILASALLATTEALTINRAHVRAHREAAKLEVRGPEPAVVVVTHTVKKYVKYVKTPSPAKSTPEVVVAAQVQPPPVVTQPAPAPVKEEPKKEEPKKEEPKKEETKPTETKPTTGGAPAVSGGKRGLVYAGQDGQFVSALKGKCSWGYNWSGVNARNAPSDLEFVPMCWNPSKCEAEGEGWAKNVEKAVSQGAKAVLSFNEPERGEEANMSPGQAAADHKRLFGGLKGVKIGSPGITSEGDKGLNWLKEFFGACGSDCPVDFCAVHMYAFLLAPGDMATKIEADIKYLEDYIDKASTICGGKKIWLTEFSVAKDNDAAIQSQFMDAVIPRLESNPKVERYSYFMASKHKWSGLVDDNGPTSVGMKYATGF